MNRRFLPENIYLVCLVFLNQAFAYTAIPRWGQATVLLEEVLYVHGGKTDPFNSYSYTSAPNNNDLLLLDLSGSFQGSSPPWNLVSSSSNSSTSQGPSLAWHTLSAFNTSEILLFGGDPGPNSLPPVTTRSDSSWILDAYNRLIPQWISESQGWANQPMRRIHHSTSSIGGKIWIIGGMKDDGSNTALSDHWVFDPNSPSFTQLPSTDGPPDLYGHVSIALPDGSLVVFGGYCESLALLIPFSTIWVLDTTQTTLAWATLTVSNSNLPTPRRGFVAVILEDGRIIIHGGSNNDLSTTYSDGWILDTTTNPMSWSPVAPLSQLGPRRDHFAVSSGPDQVVFGFGYASNGPAPASLQIYNASSGSFVPSFSPPSPTSKTNTLPIPTQTSGSNTGYPASATSPGTHHSGSPTGTDSGSSPTSSNGSANDSDDSKSHSIAIALGTLFGVFGLVAGTVATSVYIKRRQRAHENRFLLLGHPDDEEDNPHPGPTWLPWGSKTFRTLGAGLSPAVEHPPRRDMLADEDTREFGTSRRQGSEGSSWSFQSMTALFGPRLRSREPSAASGRASSLSNSWVDPFSDGVALMREVSYNSRPHIRRQPSYASAISYTDPFADQKVDLMQYDEHSDNENITETTRLNVPVPPPTLQTVFPLGTDIHTLSPLTEHTSHTSLANPSSISSQDPLSPFEASCTTSFTSHNVENNSLSSIAGTATMPNQPMRRSDSWWTRFSRTPFLDRRSNTPGRLQFDFRDPNPPPRLVAIEESAHSKSPETPPSGGLKPSRRNSQMYSGAHGRSASSLRTADSEALEKMGGTMDVVQRLERVGTHDSRGTTTSSAHGSPEDDTRWVPAACALSLVDSQVPSRQTHDDIGAVSPAEMSPADRVEEDNSVPRRPSPVKRPTSGGAVAARIRQFERQNTNDDEDLATSPRNTRKREERPSKNRVIINYGMVPRPSLYIANPSSD